MRESRAPPPPPPQSPGDPRDLIQLGQPCGRIPSLAAPPPAGWNSPPWSLPTCGTTRPACSLTGAALSASRTSPPPPQPPTTPCPVPSQLGREALPAAWARVAVQRAHCKERRPQPGGTAGESVVPGAQGCSSAQIRAHTRISLSKKRRKKKTNKEQKTFLLPHPALFSKLNLLVSTTFKDTLSKPPSRGRAGPDVTGQG